jgi:hypothetical protein
MICIPVPVPSFDLANTQSTSRLNRLVWNLLRVLIRGFRRHGTFDRSLMTSRSTAWRRYSFDREKWSSFRLHSGQHWEWRELAGDGALPSFGREITCQFSIFKSAVAENLQAFSVFILSLPHPLVLDWMASPVVIMTLVSLHSNY